MKPIRVLYFASTNSKSGGSIHSLADLASSLHRSGHVEPLVVLPDKGTAEEFLQSVGVPYIVLKNYGSEWPLKGPRLVRSRFSHFRQRLVNLKSIKEACRLVRDRGIDLIHINTSVNEIGYYVARRTKTPFIWHIREFVNEGLGLEFYNPKRVYRHMKKADAIVAISSQLQKRYEQALFPKRVLLVHNGIDTQRFYFSGERSREGPLVMAMVGRVSRLKGHYLIADAIAENPELDVKLLIVGAPDTEFEAYVQSKGIAHRVEFSGYQDDVLPYLRRAHVVVSAHPWEAFGRVIVEAMAAGCCVIAANNAGPKDVILDGETGFLFEPGDKAALRLIISNLIRSYELIRKVARAGQKVALSTFTLSEYCNKVFSVYDAVIKKRRFP